MIITAGLYIAGKKKEAAMIARRLCDKMKDEADPRLRAVWTAIR
jgi:hypothetical protein